MRKHFIFVLAGVVALAASVPAQEGAGGWTALVEKALGLTKKVAPKAPGSAAEKLTATTAVTKADGAASRAGESDKPKAGEGAGRPGGTGSAICCYMRQLKHVAHEAVKQQTDDKQGRPTDVRPYSDFCSERYSEEQRPRFSCSIEQARSLAELLQNAASDAASAQGRA